ncbi:MAG: AMP-binding protein, partial [bacterium]|nr:AMP-binding protein [bacterium]
MEYVIKLLFIAYFKTPSQAVAPNPIRKIGEIEMITGEEKQMLLHEFNDTAAEYPNDKTLHRLFEIQAERTPDSIAVSGVRSGAGPDPSPLQLESPVQYAMQLSYRELNEKSNRLAGLLRKKGVESDGIVCIMIERSIEMVIGLMAILKAGAAYLPVAPDYPAERINYMLKDSNAQIVLKRLKKSEEIAEGIEIIDI